MIDCVVAIVPRNRWFGDLGDLAHGIVLMIGDGRHALGVEQSRQSIQSLVRIPFGSLREVSFRGLAISLLGI